MKRPEWKRAAVLVTVGPEEAPGQTTVGGWICDAAPGLAVSRSVSDERVIGAWSVTHVASGRVIVDGLTLKKVRRVALDITSLADWTATIPKPKPAETLLHLAVFAIGETHRKNPRHLITA